MKQNIKEYIDVTRIVLPISAVALVVSLTYYITSIDSRTRASEVRIDRIEHIQKTVEEMNARLSRIEGFLQKEK